MHEFALVSGLMEAVLTEAEKNGIQKINIIKIVVGEMTAALPDALKFSFEILSRDTPAQGAELMIDKQALQLDCRQCRFSFPGENLNYSCPQCGSGKTEIVKGQELYIEYFEGE